MASEQARVKLGRMVAKLKLGRGRRHVFLCAQQTKPRCSTYEESNAVWHHLKERLKALGLDGAAQRSGPDAAACIHRSKVDCLRVCTHGPIAVIYPDGTWYHSVSIPVMDRIIEEHLIGGVPVAEYVFARDALA